MVDGDEYGTVSGMRTGSGNPSTHRKPATLPLHPAWISNYLTWDQTQDVIVAKQ
jgi:hypothetical protein